MRTIFESFVRNLKKHPLLGVDCVCFFCWDREELVSICEYAFNAKLLDNFRILTGASNALMSSFMKCAPLNEIYNRSV